MNPTYQIVGTDGQTYGPVTLEQINGWIGDGRITRDTSISRSDCEGWFTASQFQELNFSAAPVAATPVITSTPAARSIASVVPADPATEAQIKRGANWFYWIAALSLINSIIAFTGSDWGFILGLGVTQLLDVIGASTAGATKIVIIGLNFLVLGLFVLFGIFANKKHIWAFIVGMILYGLDGGIYIFSESWLSVGFHAFALFGMFGGLKGCFELRKSSR